MVKYLKPVCDYYKTRKMCNEAVDNYSQVLEIFPEC